jgi:hypothetical protein
VVQPIMLPGGLGLGPRDGPKIAASTSRWWRTTAGPMGRQTFCGLLVRPRDRLHHV